MKNKYIEFIEEFSKINVSGLCRKLGIHRGNILNGKASEHTTKLLYIALTYELIKLLNKYKDIK